MSVVLVDILKQWYGDAQRERSKAYAYVGLHPIKKNLSTTNGFIARIESAMKNTRFLDQPLLQRENVNFLNAYLSWFDFFNDVKAAVVKPLVVLLLMLKHTGRMLVHMFGTVWFWLSQREESFRCFNKAVESLVVALIYMMLAARSLVVYAHMVSMILRTLMTLPGLLARIPEIRDVCIQDGYETVARRGWNSFATGFCSMFSTKKPAEASSRGQLDDESNPYEEDVNARNAQMRDARISVFG